MQVNLRKVVVALVSVVAIGASLLLSSPTTIAEVQERVSQVSEATNDRVVMLAFFGLVKKIDEEQVHTLRTAILEPLRSQGYQIEAVLYTHKLKAYVSSRSQESAPFDQDASIAELRKLLPNIFVVMEEPRNTDEYFASRLPLMLKYGNFFEKILMPNPNETMVYWCRQQYSLLRVTELWSKQYLFEVNEVGSPERSAAEIKFMKQGSTAVKGVIYLRPDLYYFSQLNMDAFDAVTELGVKNMQMRNVSSVQRMSAKEVRLIHPWVAAVSEPNGNAFSQDANESLATSLRPLSKYPMHIGIPMVEYGGVSDRFAFGSPDVMLAYGMRGLTVQYYVELFQIGPHPETTLHKYLCSGSVRIHTATTFFSLKRTHGGLLERGAVSQRAQVLGEQLPKWSAWMMQQPLEEYGYGNISSCHVDAWWMSKPLPESSRREHKTHF